MCGVRTCQSSAKVLSIEVGMAVECEIFKIQLTYTGVQRMHVMDAGGGVVLAEAAQVIHAAGVAYSKLLEASEAQQGVVEGSGAARLRGGVQIEWGV